MVSRSPSRPSQVSAPSRLLEHLDGGAAWADLTSASAELGRACAQRAQALGAFAEVIVHVGDNGAGYLAKLLVSLLWFTQAAATTEALLLAQRHGVPPAVIYMRCCGAARETAPSPPGTCPRC